MTEITAQNMTDLFTSISRLPNNFAHATVTDESAHARKRLRAEEVFVNEISAG
jgi:hypothetical protein